MKRKFSNKVNYLMEKSVSPSLQILLEKDEEETNSKEDTSVFDLPDDEEEVTPKKDDDDDQDVNTETDDDQDVTPKDDENTSQSTQADSKSITVAQWEKLTGELAGNKKIILDTTSSSNDEAKSVTSFMAGQLSAGITENKKIDYLKNSIQRFLAEKKELDVKEVEADIEVLDAVLTKGTELVNKFKEGQDIDIEAYAESAIHAFKNFDSLFSKEEIVKQAANSVLVLVSGSKAKKNISEFEELFFKKLNKEFGIENEEYILNNTNFNPASGSRNQG